MIFGAVSADDQYKCDVFVIMPFKPNLKCYTHMNHNVCGIELTANEVMTFSVTIIF